MASSRDEAKKDIPDIIYDNTTKTSYSKGRFFGKGGFAKCYEVIQMDGSKAVYAGKIVSKKLMAKHNQKEKMTQEIMIHRSLNHKHVVGFHSFFEDNNNIYILLELCKRRSMMELHKRRKAITEPETRYYLHQILLGVSYLHNKKIIHRDLKLGNIFLDEDLNVKIGDFGLATRIEYDGERKKTLCGTPNYIAPEVLNKKGHSFEVDIWSIGCIMYTLMAGKPPFETSTLKETYVKIKKCEYKVPLSICMSARKMIVNMLQSEPFKRPSVDKLLQDDFFTDGFMPTSLPVSCLTMEPRFDQVMLKTARRTPLVEVNGVSSKMGTSPRKAGSATPLTLPESGGLPEFSKNLVALRDQLDNLMKKKPARECKNLGDEMTDPAAQPLFWVSKWVDYSDKYGFGYQLCDDSVGVMFNDTTKLIMFANGVNVHYINHDHQEAYMTVDNFPDVLEKKMKLLTYFHRYMREHLMKAGAQIPVKECDHLSRIPHLHHWLRTSSAAVMHLSNGIVQINFFDHSKIIMCPLMASVTYIDEQRNFRTYRFQTLEENGCSKGLARNLRYALEKISSLIQSEKILT